ncbi:MAG: hypothetical protein WCP92_03930 [bacterium]
MNISDNKKTLSTYHEVITTALQHFPELKDINIQFIQKKWFHFTLASLINRTTLFGSRSKRKYTIIINTQVPAEFEHVLFDKLSKNIQIGMLGHELAHVVDYQQRNFLQIIKILLFYFIPSRKQKFERSIDIIAIKHGM